MSTTTISIDPKSARLIARNVKREVTDGVDEKLETLLETCGGELNIEELRECIKSALERVIRHNGSDCVKPDYARLSASMEDIRYGRCRDIQEVIDAFQDTDGGIGD